MNSRRWFTYSDFKNKLNNNEIICGYMCKTGEHKNKLCGKKLKNQNLYQNFHPLNRRCLSCRCSKGVNWTQIYNNDLPNNIYHEFFNDNNIKFHPNRSISPGLTYINNADPIRQNPRNTLRNEIQEQRQDDYVLTNNTLRNILIQLGDTSEEDEEELIRIVSQISLETYENEKKEEEKIPVSISNININTEIIKSEIQDCSICQNNKSNYVIVPCGHVCLCQDCISNKAHEKIQNKCPICRIDISTITKLFF
jgi:hypothetical protein